VAVLLVVIVHVNTGTLCSFDMYVDSFIVAFVRLPITFACMHIIQAQRAAEAAVRRELDAWHKTHPTASAHTADDKAALQV
jgi:hypothetical protein